MKMINGVEHTWDIMENAYVPLEAWNEIEAERLRQEHEQRARVHAEDRARRKLLAGG